MAIDKIKAAMKLLADLRNATAEALKDGKFEWQEAFGFIPALMQIQDVVKTKDELIEQVKTVTHEQRAELEAYAKEILTIEAAEVEQFISQAVDWVILTIQVINKGSDLRTVASTPS